jgi:surfeit locus 1 family protein
MNQKQNKKSQNTGFPMWATVFSIVGFSLLCSLGFWQIERLKWKTDLLEEIFIATETNLMNNRLTSGVLKTGKQNNAQFLSGYAIGSYLHSKEIFIGPRTYKGLTGYHMITPLQMESGGILLVNRGWLPEDKIEKNTRKESLSSGMLAVSGIARIPDPRGPFIPDNDVKNKEWYWIDIKSLKKAYYLENVAPYVLYEKQMGARAYSFPIPLGMSWVPENNHKQYAIFWFSMAGLLLVFYFLRFIKPII